MASQLQQDLKGLTQLSQDGIVGVVDLVESMHQRIYTLGGLLSRKDTNKTTGLTGFIYNTIRKTTQLSIQGIDLALATFKPTDFGLTNLAQRNQWVSMLNGVLGDHLAISKNPLAIEMTLTHQGQTITATQAAEISAATEGDVMLMIHGLCMNDQLWLRQGHDHGQALAKDLSISPIYLRYNSGLAIHQNGVLLANILNEFVGALPVEKRLHLLCHSMGGLVARSAMEVATKGSGDQQLWLPRLGKTVFIGTPHQGALLEKSGHLLDYLISISPYSAPFIKLTGARSQGIKDLRLGRISPSNTMSPIPDSIKTYAIAGSRSLAVNNNELQINSKGDGLVTVKSALGLNSNNDKELNIPTNHQFIVPETNHMHLLSSPVVFVKLQQIFTATE